MTNSEQYIPDDEDIDSTFSDSLSNPETIKFTENTKKRDSIDINTKNNNKNNHLSAVNLHRHDSRISCIHSELEANDMNNNELDQFAYDMKHELRTMMDQHTRSRSHVPMPALKSVKSLPGLGGLSVMTDIAVFKPKTPHSGGYTPTLKTKETKELCEKLDNINILVNEINQYIMNNKSMKKISSDKFIINKLTEIQDDIEDSEMYIEEHIDKKLIELVHTNKLNEMNNNKQEQDIKQLKQRVIQLQSENNTKSHTLIQLRNYNSMKSIEEKEQTKERKETNKSQINKIKKECFNWHYMKMNEFILLITQKEYKLPLKIIEIISQKQNELIEENKQFKNGNSAIEKQQNDVDCDEKLIVEIDDYNKEYVKHKSNINKNIKQLQLLNINSLQLQLDTMDILNNKHKEYYKLFLQKFIHYISRIFLDCKAINTNLININDITETSQNNDEYISENILQMINKIPLVLSIIKLTDILLNNNNININNLKVYTQNIKCFQDLLSNNGTNEFEFFQKFAVQLIHNGIIKKNNFENQIKKISNIFLSLIARNNYGYVLLNEIFDNNIDKFIEFMILIVENPPILNQINARSEYRKKHKKNYKKIIMNQFTNNDNDNDNNTYQPTTTTPINSEVLDNKAFNELIKNYYDLYSNKIQIKNLKRFERFIRKKNIYYESESDSESESNEYDSDEFIYNKNKKNNTKECQEDEEINSLMKFFNDMYQKPAKLFVKCID